MGKFVKVGNKADFDDLESGKLAQASGHSIAIFDLAGKLYAIDNTCTHRGGPLAEGQVAGEEVICPWHGAHFNFKTGVVTSPPAPTGVKSYAVRVTANDVEVKIS